MHLLVSDKYVDSIRHDAAIKVGGVLLRGPTVQNPTFLCGVCGLFGVLLTSVDEDWHYLKSSIRGCVKLAQNYVGYIRIVGNSHSYLFVRGLRNGIVSSSEDVVLNGRMGSD